MRSVRNEKGCGSSSPGCTLGLVVVDRAAVEPRRRAGLEAAQARKPSRTSAPLMPAVVPSPARPPGGLASPVCISACRNVPVVITTRASPIHGPAAHRDADDSRPAPARRASTSKSSTTSCRSDKTRLRFDQPLDFLLIGLFVGLGPGAVHGRALAAIEQPELNAGGIDGPAHQAAQGVDFADDLPLGHAADGRIAAHLADGIEIRGQQRRAGSQARRGRGRFRAGMAGADHHHVEVVLGGWHACDYLADTHDTVPGIAGNRSPNDLCIKRHPTHEPALAVPATLSRSRIMF